MTDNPRNRNRQSTDQHASQPRLLPSLPDLNTGIKVLDDWASKVNERLEVGQGARGNGFDQWLTRRDLGPELSTRGVVTQASSAKPDAGAIAVMGPGGLTYTSYEDFANSIKSTKLYSDLLKHINDPTRFDGLPEKTRQLLLQDIADVAAKVGASIRRQDETIQTTTDSFAQTVTEVTAAVQQAQAGVREVRFASANANNATAGVVTQVQARLDNFSGGAPGTATVESKMTAIANRATGLEAQYTLKVTAGGAMAGFGVAATTNVSGNATSAFIVQADKFAIVDSSYAGGLTNSPSASAIMFGVDGTGAYFKGDIRGGGNINVTGSAQFGGSVSAAGSVYGATFNEALNAHGGLWAGSSGSFNAIVGSASGPSAGVFGISTNSAGVGVSGDAPTGVGVQAAGAISLLALGPMTLDNSTFTWNGHSIAAPTGSTTKFLRNDGGWSDLTADLVLVSSGNATAGAALGYLVINTYGNAGQVKVPYYAL